MTDDVMRRLAMARRLADAAGAAYRTGGAGRSTKDPGAWQLARAADLIERAAGERRRWVSYLVTVVVYPVVAWLAAELAGPVAGLPTGWAVAVAVVGFAVLCYPVARWLGRALDRAAGRRRLASARATTRPVTGDGAADLPALLRRCRRQLAAVIARQGGPGGAAALDGRRGLLQGLWYVSLADRSLCEAIMVLDPRRAER